MNILKVAAVLTTLIIIVSVVVAMLRIWAVDKKEDALLRTSLVAVSAIFSSIGLPIMYVCAMTPPTYINGHGAWIGLFATIAGAIGSITAAVCKTLRRS